MARFMCLMAFVGIIAVALLQSAAAQTVHVVGDNLGWTVPTTGASAYSTWAVNKRFMVGDILVFNFATNVHDVLQVPKASFDACTDDNPVGDMIVNGPANVTLNAAGEHYYICTIGSHCQGGQKLAINVSTPGSPLPSPSPTTPTTPTTPSPTSGSPADCTPAPTSGPTASTPSGSVPPAGTNTGFPDSSSSSVFASLLLSILAVIMGLIL